MERNGFEWDEQCVYKDEGISGTLFTDRPAIQLLLRKAKLKEINMVVFKSISRLARDLKDSLEIREVLLAHNVRIISVEEGYDSVKAGKTTWHLSYGLYFQLNTVEPFLLVLPQPWQ